jgi:hypothetical protein
MFLTAPGRAKSKQSAAGPATRTPTLCRPSEIYDVRATSRPQAPGDGARHVDDGGGGVEEVESFGPGGRTSERAPPGAVADGRCAAGLAPRRSTALPRA